MTVKTNERPGTRAVLRHCRMSSSKAREVLDLVRGLDYTRAVELLDHTDRAAAPVVAKLLRSAAANAEHNDGQFPEELFVASCYADEGTTLRRFRTRARGRGTRIRKRTCHITIIVARMPEDQIARLKARSAAQNADRRARRVAGARRRARAVEAGEAALDAGAVAATDEEATGPAPEEGVAATKSPAKKPAKSPAKKAAAKAPAKKAAPAKAAGARGRAGGVIAKIAKKSARKSSRKDKS